MNFQQQHLICFFCDHFLYDVVTTVFGLGWFGLAFSCVGFGLTWPWVGLALAWVGFGFGWLWLGSGLG